MTPEVERQLETILTEIEQIPAANRAAIDLLQWQLDRANALVAGMPTSLMHWRVAWAAGQKLGAIIMAGIRRATAGGNRRAKQAGQVRRMVDRYGRRVGGRP